MNERLCIGEVGVDLELCVHAHGHDVDPIMEASCDNNYCLDEISSDSVLRIQKPREALSLIHNAFSKLYPLRVSTMLYYRACVIY